MDLVALIVISLCVLVGIMFILLLLALDDNDDDYFED